MRTADPAAGTWELNLTKSKFSPGPPPQSLTRTFEVTGDDVKYTLKGINDRGKPTLVQFTAKYDGKDYPVTGSPDYDAISLRRVDAVEGQAVKRRHGFRQTLEVAQAADPPGGGVTSARADAQGR